MNRIDDDIINKILDFPEEITDTEVGKELGIDRRTVSRYRELEAAKQQALETLKSKKKKSGLTKEEKRKLELLEHYTDKDIQEMLNYIARNTKREIDEVIGEPDHLKFGLISDTHLGAKQCALDELGEFYDKAKDKGVECFIHCGDLVDGTGVYRGQHFEQSHVGFDDQLKLVEEKYPDVGLPTYFIGGNHSESYLKGGGADICKSIEKVRKDLINLGFYDGTIKINGITIQLRHGGGGSSYALDYKLNRFIDKIPAGKEPDIFALGHYHQALYALHRDIHGFLPGSFLKENLLSKRFQLGNTIGGWIIEIEKDSNGKSIINLEYVKF